MLAGEAPHSAPSAQAIIGRRLSEPAPPVRRARPAASPEVERTVATALAPIPADRFRTAGEMAEALDGARAHGRGARRRRDARGRGGGCCCSQGSSRARVGTFGVRMLPGAAAPGAAGGRPGRGRRAARDSQPSVAVLPLVNLSPDRENEYFSDGMTEELITALGKVEGLRVAARTSAFAFKGTQADVREIGAKLNVGTVLEGSVRRAGRRLRLSAQLVSTKDGYHIWSEEYDRELRRRVRGAGRAGAGDRGCAPGDAAAAAAGGALVKAGTADLEAHDLYLQGRFHWNQRTYESHASRRCGTSSAPSRGTRATPRRMPGWPRRTCCSPSTASAPRSRPSPRPGPRRSGRSTLDSTLGNAHAALGVVREQYEYDWAGAERELRRAIALDPGYATAHQWYAEYLSVDRAGRRGAAGGRAGGGAGPALAHHPGGPGVGAGARPAPGRSDRGAAAGGGDQSGLLRRPAIQLGWAYLRRRDAARRRRPSWRPPCG